MKAKICAITALCALSVTACGGGGSAAAVSVAPTPVPARSTPDGVWLGTTGDHRDLVFILLDNGTYYGIYSQAANTSALGGAFNGTETTNTSNSTFASSDGLDFNFEGAGISSFTASGSYTAMTSLSGGLTYQTGSSETFNTFSTQYDNGYDQTPSLATIDGSYSGGDYSAAGTDTASLVISRSGTFTATGGSGCNATGTIAPHASGNVYDVSVTLGQNCPSPGEQLSGVAYYDTNTSPATLISATLNASRSDGLLFAANRQ